MRKFGQITVGGASLAASLAGVAALLSPMTGLEANSMRIIQRPTAKRPRDKAEKQGPRVGRRDKVHKLKGIRP